MGRPVGRTTAPTVPWRLCSALASARTFFFARRVIARRRAVVVLLVMSCTRLAHARAFFSCALSFSCSCFVLVLVFVLGRSRCAHATHRARHARANTNETLRKMGVDPVQDPTPLSYHRMLQHWSGIVAYHRNFSAAGPRGTSTVSWKYRAPVFGSSRLLQQPVPTVSPCSDSAPQSVPAVCTSSQCLQSVAAVSASYQRLYIAGCRCHQYR